MGDSVFSPSTPTDFENQLAFPLPQALSRLALMGVIILGILSGFGAIRNASVLVSSLAFSRMSEKAAGKRKANISVTEEDLSHAEGSLRRVRGDLEERRAQLTGAVGAAANEPKVGSQTLGSSPSSDPKVYSRAVRGSHECSAAVTVR